MGILKVIPCHTAGARPWMGFAIGSCDGVGVDPNTEERDEPKKNSRYPRQLRLPDGEYDLPGHSQDRAIAAAACVFHAKPCSAACRFLLIRCCLSGVGVVIEEYDFLAHSPLI